MKKRSQRLLFFMPSSRRRRETSRSPHWWELHITEVQHSGTSVPTGGRFTLHAKRLSVCQIVLLRQQKSVIAHDVLLLQAGIKYFADIIHRTVGDGGFVNDERLILI
jgi:hypothetical protein